MRSAKFQQDIQEQEKSESYEFSKSTKKGHSIIIIQSWFGGTESLTYSFAAIWMETLVATLIIPLGFFKRVPVMTYIRVQSKYILLLWT